MLLHAWNKIPDSAEIEEIKFGDKDLICRLTDGTVPLQVKYKIPHSTKEVQVSKNW